MSKICGKESVKIIKLNIQTITRLKMCQLLAVHLHNHMIMVLNGEGNIKKIICKLSGSQWSAEDANFLGGGIGMLPEKVFLIQGFNNPFFYQDLTIKLSSHQTFLASDGPASLT